jgi:hypothetical protein
MACPTVLVRRCTTTEVLLTMRWKGMSLAYQELEASATIWLKVAKSLRE